MSFKPARFLRSSAARSAASAAKPAPAQDSLDQMTRVVGLASKLLLASGFVFTYAYCAHIRWFPVGMTLGETVGLFFIALGFGLRYLMLLFLSSGAVLFPVALGGVLLRSKPSRWLASAVRRCWLRSRKQPPLTPRVEGTAEEPPFRRWILDHLLTPSATFLCGVCFMVLALVVEGVHSRHGGDVAFDLMADLIKAGGYFVIFTTAAALVHTGSKRTPVPRWLSSTALIMVALGVPFVFSPSMRDRALESAFRETALRVDRGVPLLELSPANNALLRAVAARHGLLYSSCEIDGSENRLVSDLDVEWHGLGTRSLVRFTRAEGTATPAGDVHRLPSVELDAQGLRVVRTSPGSAERCLTLEADGLFFDTNSHTLTLQADSALQEAAEQIKRFALDLQRRAHTAKPSSPPQEADSATNSEASEQRKVEVRIIGHADPMPRANGTNLDLSRDRAEAVAAWFRANASFDGQTYTVRPVVGRGALEAKTSCPTTMSVQQQRECHAPNRRVELRVLLSR